LVHVLTPTSQNYFSTGLSKEALSKGTCQCKNYKRIRTSCVQVFAVINWCAQEGGRIANHWTNHCCKKEFVSFLFDDFFFGRSGSRALSLTNLARLTRLRTFFAFAAVLMLRLGVLQQQT
jgi:hypothetical protein